MASKRREIQGPISGHESKGLVAKAHSAHTNSFILIGRLIAK
jgi:hypothetical protein